MTARDDEPAPDLEELLVYLKRHRGFDFTGYKRATLWRRIRKRMAAVGAEDAVAYLAYLARHPGEHAQLFDTILINVTSFFRDPVAWEHLESTIVPNLLAGKGDAEPIRCWSAGCATGEEPYSLAIVLADALGEEAFHRRVKIYATDADEPAIVRARSGTYTGQQLEGVSPQRRTRYFQATPDGRHAFRADLRRALIFGRLELVHDAPISRIDLLVCRNTLMYLTAETQRQVLRKLHFALAQAGVLFLGKAETLLTHGDLFEPIEPKQRFFGKLAGPVIGDPVTDPPVRGMIDSGIDLEAWARLKEAALEAGATAQLVLDEAGVLVAANEQARSLFALDDDALGQPFRDLEQSRRPLDLDRIVEKATNHTISLSNQEWSSDESSKVRYVDLSVVPLADDAGARIGTTVCLTDSTRYNGALADLLRRGQELETSNEQLQSTSEELETTNEELQSANAELETTNEELASGNTELSLTNEELRSANRELQDFNRDLSAQASEITRANAFLASVLRSLLAATVAVDRDLRILTWNEQATELWGLGQEEVLGRNLLELNTGIPIGPITEVVHRILAGRARSECAVLDAENRHGRKIRCRLIVTPLVDDAGDGQGALLLMEPMTDAPDEVRGGARDEASDASA